MSRSGPYSIGEQLVRWENELVYLNRYSCLGNSTGKHNKSFFSGIFRSLFLSCSILFMLDGLVIFLKKNEKVRSKENVRPPCFYTLKMVTVVKQTMFNNFLLIVNFSTVFTPIISERKSYLKYIFQVDNPELG